MDIKQEKDGLPHKSSAEILTELFSAFNAEPPKLDDDFEEKTHKKHKKSKKKHKHKDKKHKKKSKHKRSPDSRNSSDSESEILSQKRKHKKKYTSSDYENKLLNGIKEESDTNVFNGVNSKQDDAFKENSSFDNVFPSIKIKDEPVDEISKNTNCILQEELNKNESSENINLSKIKSNDKTNCNKILIKDLKNSEVYEKTVRAAEEQAKQKLLKIEDGEIVDSGSESKSDDIPNDHILDDPDFMKHTKQESSKHEKKRKHRSRSRHKESKKSKKNSEKEKNRSTSRDKDKHKHISKDHSKSSHSHKSYSDYNKYKHKHEKRRSRSYSRDRSYSRHRSHSRDRSHSRHRSRSRDRSRSYGYSSHWEKKRRSKSPVASFDKKKLLEIARKNAINMLKSGTLPDALSLGPQAQEKVIAAIKAGGKTIEELTDFCKNLSKKEALGELSSVSSAEDEVDSENENGVDKAFHHPFQIKDKPSSIVMNIKNATPLPIRTSKEKSAELRMQFPVSSGQLHRKTENEWIPVPSKPEIIPALPSPESTTIVPIVPVIPMPVLPVTPPPAPPVQLLKIDTPQMSEVDIGTIVSQRLSAIRRLQENPNDTQALTQMQKVQKDMENWAQSKQQPGQFTGTTGAQILSAAELSSGYQAWARKDQLQTAAPVTGGMGMHLLQKMGWKPGEGLGKEKSGQLEPLLLEVKLDKKGLVAGGEVKNKKPVKMNKPATTKTLQGKHPVSLLGEFASKRKLGVPQYEVCFECGPDHKKNFLFKVVLNGIEYKPNVVSSTKKQAKADAALVCLQSLGILPS